MDLTRLRRRGDYEWEIPMRGAMRVPGVIYGSEQLLKAMDDKVYEQTANVAKLPLGLNFEIQEQNHLTMQCFLSLECY